MESRVKCSSRAASTTPGESGGVVRSTPGDGPAIRDHDAPLIPHADALVIKYACVPVIPKVDASVIPDADVR